MATHSSILLPGNFHGERSLEDYTLWGCKESDTTEGLSVTHLQMETFSPRPQQLGLEMGGGVAAFKGGERRQAVCG